MVAGQVDLGLPFLGLGFLQAENVRLVLGDEFLEGALPDHGADAVDVPRIEFHGLCPKYIDRKRDNDQISACRGTSDEFIAARNLAAGLALCPAIGLAQRAVPTGANGTPKAPPGLAQPLAAGPFTYHTAEGQDIRVTVLARLAWPYGIAFLPNGDLLVTQRTGELKRIRQGNQPNCVRCPADHKAITPITIRRARLHEHGRASATSP